MDLTLADWFSFIPGLIAIWAVVEALRGRPERLMKRSRIHAMKGLGISRKESKRRVHGIVTSGPATPADELNWLASAHPGQARPGSLPRGKGSPMPLTFAASSAELLKLSQAYASYAAKLRKGSFLGTATAPLIVHESQTALETSTVLGSAASGGGAEAPKTLRDVRLELPAGRTFDLWELPEVEKGTLAYDLFVSYRRHRIAPDFHEPGPGNRPVAIEAGGLETEPLPTTPAEAEILRAKFRSPRTFDSVLPRLVDWRPERVSSNGRQRLHLAMAETTYAAVLTDHYPKTFEGLDPDPGAAPRIVEGEASRLLTLSTVLVTADRKMLFAGRSKNAGSHAGLFGPAVNGNLELRPRDGILPDADSSGIPDPRRALAREAHEELGLSLDPQQIRILGLARFTVEKERGTHLLMSSSHLAQTADEVAEGVRLADPLEGRWELGGELLAVPLPTKERDVDPLLSWLLHCPQLTPHAALTGIATLASQFKVDPDRLLCLAAGDSNGGGSFETIPLKW